MTNRKFHEDLPGTLPGKVVANPASSLRVECGWARTPGFEDGGGDDQRPACPFERREGALAQQGGGDDGGEELDDDEDR